MGCPSLSAARLRDDYCLRTLWLQTRHCTPLCELSKLRSWHSATLNALTSSDIPLSTLDTEQIDRVVQTLQATITLFERRTRSRISEHQHHRNTREPLIARLPLEVFTRILLFSVPASEWSIDRLQTLALVSRYWKSVVVGTPDLWLVMKSPRRAGDEDTWRIVPRLALAKSKETPLTIVYKDPGTGLASYPQLAEDFHSLVEGNVGRWRSLDYVGPPFVNAIAALEHPSASLRSLAVHFHGAQKGIQSPM